MSNIVFGKIAPEHINDINTMCVMDGPDRTFALEETAKAHVVAMRSGAKLYGAFRDREPVGRIEIMPIDLAPVPLEGEGLWVIRCLWVLEKAKGLDIARNLMRLALDAAKNSKGVAVLTYPDWMPSSFFERFGFSLVSQRGDTQVLLRQPRPFGNLRSFHIPKSRKARLDAGVVLFRPAPGFVPGDDTVRVDAVFNSRCPWLMQYYRRLLDFASSLHKQVIAAEHIIDSHADALKLGEENLYIDGVARFSGPVKRDAVEKAIRERLLAKGLT